VEQPARPRCSEAHDVVEDLADGHSVDAVPRRHHAVFEGDIDLDEPDPVLS
jgi:hypothetical protein